MQHKLRVIWHLMYTCIRALSGMTIMWSPMVTAAHGAVTINMNEMH